MSTQTSQPQDGRPSDRCLVLDCDGVILDSNGMKVSAFLHALRDYPQDVVERFSAYQRSAFGSSRYKLVDLFFSDYLGRLPEPGERESVLEQFGRYCRENYAKQQVIPQCRETLALLHEHSVPMFVVSGSDQSELRDVMKTLGLAGYFNAIYGSPCSKIENLALVREAVSTPRTVFIGDAEADWRAAMHHGLEFHYLSPWAADPGGMQVLKNQYSFNELRAWSQVAGLMQVQ